MTSNGIFEVDADFDDISGGRQWVAHPEHRLLWAIVERAVRDLLGNNMAERTAATEWVYATPVDVAERFSFQWICEMINVLPEELYRKIANVKAHPETSSAIVYAQAA